MELVNICMPTHPSAWLWCWKLYIILCVMTKHTRFFHLCEFYAVFCKRNTILCPGFLPIILFPIYTWYSSSVFFFPYSPSCHCPCVSFKLFAYTTIHSKTCIEPAYLWMHNAIYFQWPYLLILLSVLRPDNTKKNIKHEGSPLLAEHRKFHDAPGKVQVPQTCSMEHQCTPNQ